MGCEISLTHSLRVTSTLVMRSIRQLLSYCLSVSSAVAWEGCNTHSEVCLFR
ncbi:hypothetical protein J6590_068261 [Homalodisca vitripennis]|nr:hypothetical protein J6590_068261 [Homalodisca vitripennis]